MGINNILAVAATCEQNNSKLVSKSRKMYGFWLRAATMAHQRVMGYWLLRTYGFWCTNPYPPSWWNGFAMVFEGLWVI